VCPLKPLIDSRIRELGNRGISAASLSSEDVDENNLLKGAYSFVFGSPESFLQNEKWRNMLYSDVYQDQGVVYRKPRKVFGPIKPLQNLEPCDYRAVLFTYSKYEGRFPS